MFCNEFWTLTSLQRAVDRKQKFLSLQVRFAGNLGIWFYNLGYCVCFKKTVTEAARVCSLLSYRCWDALLQSLLISQQSRFAVMSS